MNTHSSEAPALRRTSGSVKYLQRPHGNRAQIALGEVGTAVRPKTERRGCPGFPSDSMPRTLTGTEAEAVYIFYLLTQDYGMGAFKAIAEITLLQLQQRLCNIDDFNSIRMEEHSLISLRGVLHAFKMTGGPEHSDYTQIAGADVKINRSINI